MAVVRLPALVSVSGLGEEVNYQTILVKLSVVEKSILCIVVIIAYIFFISG